MTFIAIIITVLAILQYRKHIRSRGSRINSKFFNQKKTIVKLNQN
jgi:hypothetical protein